MTVTRETYWVGLRPWSSWCSAPALVGWVARLPGPDAPVARRQDRPVDGRGHVGRPAGKPNATSPSTVPTQPRSSANQICWPSPATPTTEPEARRTTSDDGPPSRNQSPAPPAAIHRPPCHSRSCTRPGTDQVLSTLRSSSRNVTAPSSPTNHPSGAPATADQLDPGRTDARISHGGGLGSGAGGDKDSASGLEQAVSRIRGTMWPSPSSCVCGLSGNRHDEALRPLRDGLPEVALRERPGRRRSDGQGPRPGRDR